MFNYKHYVSVLRWKAAEKEALGKLGDEDKKFITPLIELIMPQPSDYKIKENGVERIKAVQELLTESLEKFKLKLPEIHNEVLKFWGVNPVFIDLSLIDFSLRLSGINTIMTLGKTSNLSLIPVVNLFSDPHYVEAAILLAKKQRIALRLFRKDFLDTITKENIKSFLTRYKESERNIDLIVDLQITDNKCQAINYFIDNIPNINDWNSFTLISGIFPKNLMQFTPDMHFVDRADWNNWIGQIYSDKLLRKPSFGDYTIQHPIFEEPTPGANPSASIRYTLLDKWMIMRGQGLRSEKSAGFAQYPALANLLLERKEFFGAKFSYGDSYIAHIGKDISNKETGNPRTWLRAGINHHLACVISQISNLSE